MCQQHCRYEDYIGDCTKGSYFRQYKKKPPDAKCEIEEVENSSNIDDKNLASVEEMDKLLMKGN